jgi:hypothetical protein
MKRFSNTRGASRLGLAALALSLQLAGPLASTTSAQSAVVPAPSRDILSTAPAVQPDAPQSVSTATTAPNGASATGCADPGPADYPVSGGWFFTQEAHGCIVGHGPSRRRGYLVQDDEKGAFWTEFRRYGGLDVLGYAVTQPYHYPAGATDGYWYQAFEKGILQWQPENGRAVIANAMDMFHDAQLDDDLRVLGIPPQAEAADDNQRLSWVTEPLFLARFFYDPVVPHSSDPDRAGQTAFTNVDQAEMFFGVPRSMPDRLALVGPKQADGTRLSLYPLTHTFMAQRFQKGGLEYFIDAGGEGFSDPTWTDRPVLGDPTVVPGEARPGCLASTAVGLLARTIGSDKLIPSSATEALPLDPDHAWVDAFVPPVVVNQTTTWFKLTGSGFNPNETVTVQLGAPTAARSQPQTGSTTTGPLAPVQVKTHADGSFDVQLTDIPIGVYQLTAVGAGAAKQTSVTSSGTNALSDTYTGSVDLTVSTVDQTRFGKQSCSLGLAVGN